MEFVSKSLLIWLITVSAEDGRYRPSSLSSGSDSIMSSRGSSSSSSDSLNARAPDTAFSAPCMSENSPSPPSPSDCSTKLLVDSSLVLADGMSNSSCKRVYVYPRMPNMTIPEGCTILPRSDDKWIAYSPKWDSNLACGLTSFILMTVTLMNSVVHSIYLNIWWCWKWLRISKDGFDSHPLQIRISVQIAIKFGSTCKKAHVEPICPNKWPNSSKFIRQVGHMYTWLLSKLQEIQSTWGCLLIPCAA